MHHPTDRIIHTTAFGTPVVEHWLEREIAQWVHPMKDRSDDPSYHERTILPRSYISLIRGIRAKLVYDEIKVNGRPNEPPPLVQQSGNDATGSSPNPQNTARKWDTTSVTSNGGECTTSNSLKITFLNVCGTKSKLLNPDFHVLIQNYYILVFVETKLDNFDVLQLPVGYAYHVKTGNQVILLLFINKLQQNILIFETLIQNLFFGLTLLKFCQYRIKYYLGVFVFHQRIRGIPLIMPSVN